MVFAPGTTPEQMEAAYAQYRKALLRNNPWMADPDLAPAWMAAEYGDPLGPGSGPSSPQWSEQPLPPQIWEYPVGPSPIPGQPPPVEPSWPPFLPRPGAGQPPLDPLPPPAPAPPTRLEEGASGKTVNEEISELFRSRGLILNKPSPPSGLPPGFGQPPPPTPQRQHYPGQAPPPTPARLPPGFGPSPPPTPQIAATPPGTYAPSAQPEGGLIRRIVYDNPPTPPLPQPELAPPTPPAGFPLPHGYTFEDKGHDFTSDEWSNLSDQERGDWSRRGVRILGPDGTPYRMQSSSAAPGTIPPGPDTPRIPGAMVQPEVTPSLPAAQAIPPQFSSAQMASSQMAEASPAASTVAPPLARSVAGPSMTLVNSSTGDEQTIPLDGTPETSELLNSLMQQGYVNRTPPPAPPAAAPVAPAVAPAAAPAAPITGIPPQDIYEGKSLEVLDPDTGSWTSMSSVPDIERVLLKNGSAVRMPDGTMATNTGDNMGGVQAVPGGGLLINGLPINTALNPESQTPEQTAALRDLNIPAGGWPSDYAGSQTPWTGEAGPYAGAPIEDPYADWGTYATPEIPSIDLPPTERVDPRFGQDFDQWYSNVIDAQAGNLGRYYDFPTPQTGAAMMPLGMVPQPRTQTPQQFEALQFLLSGQGYDPATMARMRASATDAAAMAGQSGAGTARLMAQQAGLTGSPAAMAMEASARRMQGGATTRALNQIEIANAMQGMQNRATGAGMELNRQTSGAAMANQMALSNASNILGAMQTNVGNLQQSSLFNVGNRLGQQMTQAGQQSGLYGQGAGTYNQAALRRAGETAFFNPTQQMTRDFRQAQLKREKDLTDAGFSFNRFSGAQNLLGGLAGGTGSDFYGTGTNLYQWGEPGSAWAGLNFLSPAASGGVG